MGDRDRNKSVAMAESAQAMSPSAAPTVDTPDPAASVQVDVSSQDGKLTAVARKQAAKPVRPGSSPRTTVSRRARKHQRNTLCVAARNE